MRTQLLETIEQQARIVSQVEQGDLSMHVDVKSENDIMGKSLSSLVGNLNNLVSSIITASDQVTSGAQLVSNSSMVLSQGATEQASAVEELTATLEQMSAQTRHNAGNANQANEYTENAKHKAEQGNNQMQEMLKAMEKINLSSGKINKIIKVIDDIAFQTNILALNAAVEAARAGQHGKGFAVVAEEVRTLAAKSATAAKETTIMIEDSIKNVETGIVIANDTASTLSTIASEVSNVNNLIRSIAIASNEQAQGIAQLNQGITQVSQVVQTNAANSEESAAASEELAAQAEQLKELVNVFKIKESSRETNILRISSSAKRTSGMNHSR